MRSGVGLVCYDAVAIGELPMDIRVKVGKCLTKITVEFAYAHFVRRHVWLRCVVDEVVREKLFKDVKSSFSLNLFGIAANNSFCGVGCFDGAHASTAVRLKFVVSDVANLCSVCKISAARSPMNDARSPGVAGSYARHDKAIGDTEVFDSIDFKFAI
jgi:hypothetical protein